MSIETPRDFEGLRAAGAVVAETLARVRKAVRAGVTTRELDAVARDCFDEHGARSGPHVDYGFPGTICLSINDEAVHGVPGPRVVMAGDLVTIDVTAELDGYYCDAAITVVVEPAAGVALRLRTCAEAAFRRGLEQARAGVPLWRVGAAVEREVKRRGFRVLRDLYGHGIGRSIHEEPSVPSFHDSAARSVLTDGLVITIEPIVAVSASRSRTLADGWTIVSSDRSLTAHHEHTIVVRNGEPHVLTRVAA